MNKKLKSIILIPFNALYKIAPVLETKLLYRIRNKSNLNLKNPKTYNEKLNWLKLFYRNDLMPLCADKYFAREYISKNGYEKFLPKLYWQGNNFEEIPFETLPDSFVLKSTSGSGNNIIVHNKKELDIKKTKKIVNNWLKEKYLPAYGEWHYSHIKPSIIIEELLSDGQNYVPLDYKFFCFKDGEVGCIAVDLQRYIEHKRNIYDSEWNFLKNVNFNFPIEENDSIEKPKEFDKMKEIAKKLAEPFPHCRVDFFVIGNRFYIGELTFFNGAALDKISPEEYNLEMGSWIDLPKKQIANRG